MFTRQAISRVIRARVQASIRVGGEQDTGGSLRLLLNRVARLVAFLMECIDEKREEAMWDVLPW